MVLPACSSIDLLSILSMLSLLQVNEISANIQLGDASAEQVGSFVMRPKDQSITTVPLLSIWPTSGHCLGNKHTIRRTAPRAQWRPENHNTGCRETERNGVYPFCIVGYNIHLIVPTAVRERVLWFQILNPVRKP